MDNIGLIDENKNKISTFAVDGLLYGLVSGVAMILGLSVSALFTRETPSSVLEHFGASELTSPEQGLLSHLAASAIYGVLFGLMIWLVLTRISSAKIIGWVGGLVYAAFLLFLAQTAILPVTGSPLGQLPFWQWALAHGVYGLVLDGLFARKMA